MTNLAFRFLSFSLFVLIFSNEIQAKTFKTAFIRMELPSNWDCKQEEASDWVCQPDNISERSEAIAVIVTKEANEVDDSLEKYLEYLKVPRDMRDLVGNAYKSDIKFARKRKIMDHEWIDALHLGSEIPGFYTRYVASTKEKIAGLITYSVSETNYPKYATILDRMIDSAQLYFDPKAFDEARNANPTSLLGARGKSLRGRMDPKFEAEKVPDAKPESNEGIGSDQMIALGILAAVIGYVIYKRKKRLG